MPIKRLRLSAFETQRGKCFYCTADMWFYVPEELTIPFNLPAPIAGLLQCTAEHVVARCDGGRDTQDNIVAACLRCNGERHRMDLPLPAHQYLQHVRRQVQRGNWHRAPIYRRGLIEVQRSR